MFVFKQIDTFWAPVAVMTPGGEEQTFEAEFAYLDDQAHDALVTGEARLMPEVLQKIWRGWRGIQDAAGQEIAYSADQRDVFLRHQYLYRAVFNAYAAARAGLRAKNS